MAGRHAATKALCPHSAAGGYALPARWHPLDIVLNPLGVSVAYERPVRFWRSIWLRSPRAGMEGPQPRFSTVPETNARSANCLSRAVSPRTARLRFCTMDAQANRLTSASRSATRTTSNSTIWLMIRFTPFHRPVLWSLATARRQGAQFGGQRFGEWSLGPRGLIAAYTLQRDSDRQVDDVTRPCQDL